MCDRPQLHSGEQSSVVPMGFVVASSFAPADELAGLVGSLRNLFALIVSCLR